MDSIDDIDMSQETEETDGEIIEEQDDIETEIVIKDTVISETSNNISDEQLYSLYQCFNINFYDLARKYCNWRLNVIHMRGVQQMSSDDILLYFNDYEPNSIEWCNDLSCNIVFNDERSAAVAMLALTTAIVVKSSKQNIDIDYGVDVINADTLEVPVPPSFVWRLGKAHHKAKALLLRFAVQTDRKTRLSAQTSAAVTVRSAIKRNDRQSDDTRDKRDDNLTINAKRMRMRADDEEELLLNVHNKKRLTVLKTVPTKETSVVESPKCKSIWDRLDSDEQGNYCAVDADLLELAVVNNEMKFKDEKKKKQNNVWNRVDFRQTNRRSRNRNDLRNKLSND